MIEEYSSMTNTDKKEEIDMTKGINIPGVKINL